MYVPPFETILHSLNLTRADLQEGMQLQVPIELFLFLLQLATANEAFDTERYGHANPDVASAVRYGTVHDLRQHYIRFGYFEARPGTGPKVNEPWYVQKYPDVAEAIAAGSVTSAAEHFAVAGAKEWRVPSPGLETDVMQWKKMLGGK